MTPPKPLRTSSATPTSPAPIDPIATAGQELIASYQQLEGAWRRAEAKLATSHVPTTVKVRAGTKFLGEFEDCVGETLIFLAYARIKSDWRICVIEEDHLYSNRDTWTERCTPITEAPLRVRLDMLEKFVELYQEVLKTVKTLSPQINDQVTKFNECLDLIDL